MNSPKTKKEAGQITPTDSISSFLQQLHYLIEELPADLHMLRVIYKNLLDQRVHHLLVKPTAETKLYIAWNRYQTFTPIAERFLEQLQTSFESSGTDK